MIFRPTQKLASKLRIVRTVVTNSHPSMVEWYCSLITVRRRQFFLFTHAPSLFSFWVPAARSTRDDFGQMFRRAATDTLRDYGVSNSDIAKVTDDGPDIANGSPMRKIGMENPIGYLRHILDLRRTV